MRRTSAISRHWLHRQLIVLSFLACLFLPSVLHAASPLQPDRLTCEFIKNPLGIAVQKPRFTWTMKATERGQRQTAFELVVSDNLIAIQAGKGTSWTSRKKVSSQNNLIEYNGVPLQSFKRYYWRVKVYNQDGEPSGWSEPAWFETAMLSPADWKALWIGDGRKQFEKDEEFYQLDPMPLFRKRFGTAKKLTSARLYVAGVGYCEAYLNGKKLGDHLLDPGWTTYKKRVLYVTYDLTGLLQAGQNTLGFMLGNGWYNPLPLRLFGRFNLRDVQQTGRPCVKAQILLRYADGTEETIATDNSWQTTTGPVVRNNVYLGEEYDARLERIGWTLSSSSEESWKAAAVVAGPSGELVPQMQPPIRTTTVVKPQTIKEVGKDTFLVDMGQNFAGVARIRVQGPAGRQVALRYGEDIHPDGQLNYLTTVAGQIKEIWHLNGGPGSPKTAWQQDRYTLKGNGGEEWSPRFTFHGFRYVEITGWPGKPTLADIEGLRMNADVESVGEFSCSNEMFNRLLTATQWTFKSNLFSVQSDCPGREKMGYGADMVVTAEAFLYNFDMAQFYRKAVQDYAAEQQPDGGITEIAPYTGIADRGYGGESGPLGWQLAFPFLQKKLYEFYGDRRIIEENYPAIQKQLQFLKAKEINGLFHWDISDHEALDPKPEAFTAAAFYYHIVSLAAEFAGILGKQDDSVANQKWAARIKDAIVRKYLVPNTGRFDNATQSAQLFALWYGLAENKNAAMNVLLQEVQRHHDHLSTGIFATKFLFDVMREENKADIAYTIANQRSFPGWGYMLDKGATTLWETWQKPDNAPSQNHPMFGSVTEWFYRSLLGINAAAPGFQKIIIKPQPVGDLIWVKGSYNSVQGVISSDWKREGNRFSLEVQIPANTTAEVWLPATKKDTIMESGKSLKAQQIAIPRYENGYAVINLGSGTYRFQRN